MYLLVDDALVVLVHTTTMCAHACGGRPGHLSAIGGGAHWWVLSINIVNLSFLVLLSLFFGTYANLCSSTKSQTTTMYVLNVTVAKNLFFSTK